MSALQWARLRADLDCQLRRGAWYRVTLLNPEEVEVSVQARPFPIPRRLLEIRTEPPDSWTVVRHPRPSPNLPSAFWHGYVVCPVCRYRTPLPRNRIATLRCPDCYKLSKIAWEEKYLE